MKAIYSKLNQSISLFLLLALGLLCVSSVQAEDKARSLNIGVVNFKSCVENSKLGKQEQGSFEKMKKQMEAILEEKEKGLEDLSSKLNDPDYLDSLAPDAETELKRKFRTQTQEITQQQSQFYQTLQQANVKILQKISEQINKAATEVAKEKKLDLILSEDSTFYYANALDVSKEVTAKMDANFDREPKDQPKNNDKDSIKKIEKQ